MARIYAEEVQRRGSRVKLAFEQQAEQDTKASASAAQASDEKVTRKPISTTNADQEVIVLRGGFTRW